MSAQHAPPPMQLMQHITGSWISQAVGVVARLGVADHMVAGPSSVEELARLTGAHPESLFRVMRLLGGIGIFAQPEPRRFALTPLSELLRTDAPGSLRYMAIAETDHAHWASWSRLPEAVRTGEPQARPALQMDPWDYYREHPEDGDAFSRAMANISSMAIPAVLGGYDFSAAATIADVGGAYGALLAAILQANPSARGILFDLPNVIEAARPVLAEQGLSDRIAFEGGSFLEQAVPSADLYLLKHILHDWDDARCTTILQNIHKGMKPSSRLLVVEMLIPPGPEHAPSHAMDLNMMVMVGGKERTESEFAQLFQTAGLRLSRAIPTPSPFVLLEATPG